MKAAPIGIHSSDLVALLKGEGFPVPHWRLRYAAARGHIPTPFTTTSGDHSWKADDLPAICRYFKNPRRPGRPPKAA